ncbi:putative inorganic phosphate transporter 1-13 [Triticum dicoccoides]|uniref:putative inorganic phosphate transporter 1-13 n=1 Tax=Triticum dicoccoides TaxID=85692 RepID=UPI0018900F4C|nr:putative inorganic phosphate transporter 1-13 [Triticum dicoccoides]
MARNQQLRVLQALDVARTQLYHFMAIVIAGMGFFTDAYDLFTISLVADLIDHRYNPDGRRGNFIPVLINAVSLCGTVPGQLVFGWLGDKMGRKRIYGVTLLLMVFCSLASGFTFGKSTNKSVLITLCFFRFWLGFSIGGDYPLSATIMSEYANKRTRGAFMAVVFAMQGFGNVAAGLVGTITSAAFLNSSPDKIDYVWRIVLMFGAVPALLTYYWRMKMPETARYTALIAKDAKMAASDMSAVLNMHIVPEEDGVNELASQDQYGLFSSEFLRRHGLHLLSTTVCWFVLDVTFYSLNMFMKDILTKVRLLDIDDDLRKVYCQMASPPVAPGYPKSVNQFKRTMRITGVHTVIAAACTLPGYFFAVAFIDHIGRVKIQLLGFTMMTVFQLCLAIPYPKWLECNRNKYGFAVLYGFTFFFANFGPNTTTFILPAELFPARLRSTCHGISGAVGKIGAVVGVFAFHFLRNQFRALLFVLVGCNLGGIMFTLLLPETMGKSLEEITGETEEGQTLDDEATTVNADDGIHVVAV